MTRQDPPSQEVAVRISIALSTFVLLWSLSLITIYRGVTQYLTWGGSPIWVVGAVVLVLINLALSGYAVLATIRAITRQGTRRDYGIVVFRAIFFSSFPWFFAILWYGIPGPPS